MHNNKALKINLFEKLIKSSQINKKSKNSILSLQKRRDNPNVTAIENIVAVIEIKKPYQAPQRAPANIVNGEHGKNRIAIKT
jgi:hypothetical protein